MQLAAEPRMLDAESDELQSILAFPQAVPYFDQFFVVDAISKNVIAGYPESTGGLIKANQQVCRWC